MNTPISKVFYYLLMAGFIVSLGIMLGWVGYGLLTSYTWEHWVTEWHAFGKSWLDNIALCYLGGYYIRNEYISPKD